MRQQTQDAQGSHSPSQQQRPQNRNGQPPTTSPTSTATTPVKREDPMFQLGLVPYTPSQKVVCMAISNQVVVLALRNNHIIRQRLGSGEVEDIEVSRSRPGDDCLLSRVFLDPTGSHLLVTTVSGDDNYYLHATFRKPRSMPRMRGVVVESVAWDGENRDPSNSKEVLVGSSRGKIFLTSFEASEKKLTEIIGVGGKDQQWRMIYAIDGEPAVTGLRYERFPPTEKAPVKFFVMAATPTRLYEFIGGPSLDSMMGYYEQSPSFREIPPGTVSRGDLAFFSRVGGSAQSFSWLTGPGIFHGTLSYGMQEPGDNVSNTDCRILGYPATALAGPGNEPPLSVMETEFHYLLLYERGLACVNKLSEAAVWECQIPQQSGRARCMAHDISACTFWVACENHIYELEVRAEDRDVWRLYMQRGEWETAVARCGDDPGDEKKSQVLTAQGQSYFASGKYELAAKCFSRTRMPLEEVSLMFVSREKRDALKVYLIEKLRAIPASSVTQITVVATWLVEMFLNKLNELDDQQARQASATSGADAASQQRSNAQYEMVEDEFHQFLTEYKSQLDRNTTYDLISSHARESDLLFYAREIGDYERVISHYIREREYRKALEVMRSLPAKYEDLFYRFSPELIAAEPEKTVECWISASSFLKPRKLFPALMRYEAPVGISRKLAGQSLMRRSKFRQGSKQFPTEAELVAAAVATAGRRRNEGIRYLIYCVMERKNEEPAVHNYLLSLLAQQGEAEEPGTQAFSDAEAALLAFVDNGSAPVHYDLKYALRLCTKLRKWRACVLIYGRMGLYEEAVDLALRSYDVELAKANASKPEDEAFRKRLWLKIAQSVVQEKNDIREAVAFLKDCDLLKIEDILPFFREFTRIDEFKDEICRTLDDYNRHIAALKTEMDEATASARTIRQEIAELKNKCGVVKASARCDICGLLALSRNFYYFPCGHVFHSDCLLAKLLPSLTPTRRSRVLEIQNALSTCRAGGSSQKSGASARRTSTSEGPSGSDLESTLRSELDSIVASECAYCGRFLIDQVDDPLVIPGDPESSQWQLNFGSGN